MYIAGDALIVAVHKKVLSEMSRPTYTSIRREAVEVEEDTTNDKANGHSRTYRTRPRQNGNGLRYTHVVKS